MFRSFRNSRLGKYYSSVLAKYGAVAPLVIAFATFIALMTAEQFGVMGLVKEASSLAYTLVVVVLSVGAALSLYYACSKITDKNVNVVDLIVYILTIVAVCELVKLLFVSSATLHVVLYVVEILLLAALTIARMSIAKPLTKKLYEAKTPNATVKSYFVAFAKRFNLAVIALGAVVLLAFLFLFDGAGLMGGSEWTYLTMIALTLIVLTVLFNFSNRIKNKRMCDMDAVIVAVSIAAVLYAAPLFIAFSVFKLVAWIVALGVLAAFMVLMVKNTYLEEPAKECCGKKNAEVYFRTLLAKCNLIFAGVLAAVAFVALYALVAIDVLKGMQTAFAGGFLLVIDIAAFCLLAALLVSSRNRKVGVNDFVLVALGMFALLAIIPTVQYFSALKLVSLILVLAVVCTVLIIRAKSVTESEVAEAEVYNPLKIFSKANCLFVAKSVKKLFTPDRGSHYISSKESRRIARDNMRTIKEYEARKKRKNVPESEYVTKMKDDRNVVEFENLHTYFFSDAGVVKAVNGVTFDIPQGSTVGVIGESGCGKSVTSMSLMQLVQAPKGQVMEGSQIRFKSTAYKEDEKGQHVPVYETEKDENGNDRLDENGKPIYVLAPKKDKKGREVIDKTTGKPIMEKVQKRDQNGIPMFEMEEKVYNVAKMPTEVMRKIRGREISMIFQEPMTSLNPIFTIGAQLDEVVFLHVPGATKESAKARTFEMLKLVGIIPENVYDRYPHELSGGMRQRVCIAMALSCQPKLIIADEPTTALDVTIQAQILDLLRDIKKKINGSIMFITHDLGVIAEMADYVVVMYAGRIIEMGTAKEIFDNPMHPYTIGLQKSKPAVNKKVERLYSIPGSVPNPINMPNYCYFRDRCDKRCKCCDGDYPEMIQVSPTHKVSCHLYEKEDVNDGNE